MDIFGPFLKTELGNRYVLVPMDYYTKWPEVYGVAAQSTITVVDKSEEFFCRFAVLEKLHSDQGWNFEAHVFGEICCWLGIHKICTTPLHPPTE